MKKYLELLQTTFREWNDDNVPRLAASLAYYTAFSLAPLLIIVISIVGFFFGDEAARGQVVAELSAELGRENAAFIQEMIQNSDNEAQGIFSTTISLVMLIVGSTGVFMQLQNALNEVWDIQVEGGGIWMMLRKRLLSFGMIMSLGFLLLVSLIINSAIASLDDFLIGILPGYQLLAHLINFTIAFGVSTLLFAIIYKYMPDAKIEWRDVIIGAVVTAILFNIGRFVLGLYLGNVGATSTYGAAGSFVVILLWVYYSAQIVMFGAEFTYVYARRYGTRIVPEAGATFDTAQQLASEVKEQVQTSTEKTELPESMSVDDPIEIKDAEIIYHYDKNPGFTLMVSSIVAVISASIAWFLGSKLSD